MGLLDTGKGVADKAKNIPEISNIKKKIIYEEDRILELLADIGRKYYIAHEIDKEAFDKICEDITTRRIRIKKMKFEINMMKGFKVCLKCDSEINAKFEFCGVCGARLPNIDDEEFLKLDDSEYYVDSKGFFGSAPNEAK